MGWFPGNSRGQAVKVEGIPDLLAARVPGHVGYLARRWCPFQLAFPT